MNMRTDLNAIAAAHAKGVDVKAFLERHPAIAAMDCLFVDVTGAIRGKRVPRGEIESVFAGGMQMSYSAYFLDARGELTNAGGLGFSDGDPDGTAFPDAATLTPVAFADPARAQVIMTLYEADGRPTLLDPRQLLASVVERFKELKLTPTVAVELEFYLVDQARRADGAIQPPVRPGTQERETAVAVYGIDELDFYKAFLTDVRDACALQSVPATTANSEYGPGQFEINLHHTQDAVQAGDQAVYLKQCIRASAHRNAMRATFMSKPYLDRAGNGMHIHISLVDENGRNVFDDGTLEGSATLRHAAAGLGALMHEGMAIFAPNSNAFRRYAPNLFVPMNRRWGVNNRSTGIRVPAGPSAARRIEHRVAGADANPYLVLAAVLAGVHHGLTQRLDPGAPHEGNAAGDIDGSVPFTMKEAIGALESGSILKAYFGRYADLYAQSKRKELARYQSVITPHEYDWYL